MQTRIDPTADTERCNSNCSDLANHPLDEYEHVDHRVVTTAMLGFDFGLIYHKVDQIGPEVVKTLKLIDWERQRIGFVRLYCQLITVAVSCPCLYCFGCHERKCSFGYLRSLYAHRRAGALGLP